MSFAAYALREELQMGGIFTQKRVLPDFPKAEILIHNNGVPSQSFERLLAQCVPTQTTTSYRTHGSDRITGTDDALAQARDINSRNWLDYSRFDSGHPFDTIKQEWHLSHKLVDITGGTARFRGPLILANSASLPINTWFAGAPSFDSAFYGTKLFNMAVPNKPVADMATALGELRTKFGVPSIPGNLFFWENKARSALSKGGGEYLNVQFGWLPMISDIKKIAGAVLQSQQLVEQYLSDSGKNIYRRRELPELHTNLSITNDIVSSFLFSGFSSNDSQLFTGPGISGRVSQVVNHDRKIWFTGSFSYFLSEGIDPLDRISLYASLARKLVGARLTPEVLWELQPWSWLADWVFNLGSILENLESFQTDGLVARYAYLMCTDKVTVDVTSSRHGLSHLFGEISRRTVTTHKQRVRATPYGFGLDPQTWSAERWAILAALGLTKSPRLLQ